MEQIVVKAQDLSLKQNTAKIYESKFESVAEQPIVSGKKNEIKMILVESGDTLMILAFKLYGDIDKWKEISNLNKEILSKNVIAPGMLLKYRPPLYSYKIPEGLPYLVKHNDTLPSISRKVYGTRLLWDVILYNNMDQIQNADLIFAGFTLFYPRKELIYLKREQMFAEGYNPLIKKKRIPSSLR